MFDSNNLPEEIEFNDVRFIKNEEELKDAEFEETMQELYAALLKQFIQNMVKRFRTNANVLKRVIVMYYKLVFEF